MTNFTTRDPNQISKHEHCEANDAKRVVIVGGENLNLNIDKVDVPMPEVIKVPEIVKETSVIEIEKPVYIKETEIVTIEKPIEIIKKELQVEKIEIPVIVKETEIVEVEKPIIIKEYEIKEIQVPIVINKNNWIFVSMFLANALTFVYLLLTKLN
jgi:hypothetical protein